MSSSRARLAADWFSKLQENVDTQEVEHTDVLAAEDTPAEVLAKLTTVDGAGSGLDANLFDGVVSSSYLRDGGNYATVTLNNFIRTTGSTGWYNETYYGGITMQDSTWVRVYNGKQFHVSSTAADAIYTAGGVSCATVNGGVPSTSAIAVGAVGSYAFLIQLSAGTSGVGTATTGSILDYASVSGNISTPVPAGTWRSMGYSEGSSARTLFLRIS